MRPKPVPGALRRTLADQGGVALVLTLLVVVLLSAMIIEFDYRTRLDVRAAASFRDDTRAYLLVQGAVDAARAVLMEDLSRSPAYDYAEEEIWGVPIAGYPVGDGTISVAIVDEGGKLDLNTLVGDDGEPAEDRVDVYRRLLEEILEPDQADPNVLVDSLIDWIDPDPEQLSAFGAEAPYYERLDPPYACADAPLRTFDELALVQGYTPEVIELLRPHVTVLWAGNPTGARDGNPRNGNININTASAELLVALHEEMSLELARNIIEDRPFTSANTTALEGVIQLTDIAAPIAKLLDVKSDYFSITAQGKVGETSRTVRAVVRRTVGKERTRVLAWRVE